MNAVCLSFCLMLRMIRRDMMLLAALLRLCWRERSCGGAYRSL